MHGIGHNREEKLVGNSQNRGPLGYLCIAEAKAVPLHATEELGGEDV
jgi:hypothetical protein